MSTTAPRLLQVRRSIRVTPRMVRVTLGGDELAGFGGEGPDRRIKMFFPVPGQERPAVPRATSGGPLWPAGEARPTIRTYTVRRFDPGTGELDVDFVLHEGHGPAAAWARDVRPGSWVGVSEPGGRYEPDPAAAFHLVIGDETALPAVATVLDALYSPTPPAAVPRAKGMPAIAFLEVADAGEEQELPGAADVRWVHRGEREPGVPLAEAVLAAELPAGEGQAWLSGESACVRDLRKHLLDDRSFDRRRVYATGYWRAR
jgi:NADPH-dependent ferric siderophore reductase